MTDSEAKSHGLLMTRREQRKTKISAILHDFDFEKVHGVMTLLGWNWQHDDGDFRVPSVHYIRSTAENLLRDVQPGDDSNPCFSGGFEASIDCDDNLSLKFVLHETVAMVDEETNQIVTV